MEADPSDPEVRAHGQVCAGCADRLDLLDRLRADLRIRWKVSAPASLRSFARSHLHEISFPAPLRWLASAAAAAALVGVILLTLPREAPALPSLVRDSSRFYDDLIAGRIRPRTCSSPDELSAYFRGEHGISLAPPPELRDADLAGGCPCSVERTVSPWIVYRRGQDVLCLLVFEGAPPSLPPAARRDLSGRCLYVFDASGTTVIVCTNGPVTHVWVSRMNEGRMLEMINASPEGNDAIDGVRISVPEITCAVCCSSVRSCVSRLNGVRRASADAARRELAVEFDERAISLEDLFRALRQAGYSPSFETPPER